MYRIILNVSKLLVIIIFLFMVFSYGFYFKKGKNNNKENKMTISLIICSKWEVYRERGDIYLKRKRFIGTPMTGELLSRCAKKTYETYGVFIPVELALSQAQWESGMGRFGRSPVTNPFNLGEYSNKTVLRYKTIEEGVQSYYDLIATNYLNYGKRTLKKVFDSNFRDKNGYCYASSDTYGERIEKQYNYIITYINNNLKK
jgi:hypothetical protein